MSFPYSFNADENADLSKHDSFIQGPPLKTFKRMQQHDPLAWCPEEDGRGFWSITRHADIMDLNKQPELLSSARGIRIEDQSEEEYEARKTFQETDAPDHRKTRMLVNKAFSKATVAQYEQQIRSIVVDLFEETFQEKEFDAVDKIARQLPMRMLAQILGVPAQDADWLVERGDNLIANTDPEYSDFVVDKVDTEEYRLLPFRSPAAVDLFDYANDQLKRIKKGEDVGVLSLVKQPMKDGTCMSDAEFRNFFCLLVAAGNDTTRYSIAASLHALANEKHLMQQLKANGDALWDTATDELIRYASPTMYFRRTATRDFDYHNKTVKEGDKVILWFAAGNRDETVFANPDAIDITRQQNKFVSFGQGGPHVCLGMWLAKLEVKTLLQEIVKVVDGFEQTAPHTFLRSNFIGGIKKLPLAVKLK
ncbi:cytochrome P450 [Kordiimonas pumila]|uniref:Cytochrome P450 n=1 Tax=Kordiimonas pumila TaxID=2161677 RepID=A0ABV7D5H5_9PROT|nr:cytochrome P450 [Kordiimonas pumila]